MRLRGSGGAEARFALWTGAALALTAAATRVLAGGETTVILSVAAALYLSLILGMQRLVGSLRAQVAATQEIALHDGLTNLPNRVLFRDRAEHAIRGATRAGDKLAVMLLDLDKFKEINDTLGHEKGDRFLVEVASRLQLSLRASDTIARLGGDEFGLVIPVADTGDAQRVAARLLGELERPFDVGDLSLRAKGSIGIALFPDDGSDTETLLRKADVAMYAGKQVHLPVLYSAEHDHYSPERLLLIGELKRAIEENELVVHYQPVVDVAHGNVKGLEALVRWQHPERGLISPAQFVVFAEQTGLMELLTEAVLRIALPQCAAWRADGHDVVVAVNVSGRDLGDRTFPARVAELLAEAGLDAGALEFEITEDTLLADPLRTLTVLEKLREVGVRLAVDDFGAGRTSLHYLRKLRVDSLKIDRSFVLDLLSDTDSQAIVRSTVELAHRLGLEVVAEGVETADTLDLLAGYSCDLAQGHLFSRPVPADQLDLAALVFGSRR
jgi:diguanylate cyclase (GGDEF)-like protein